MNKNIEEELASLLATKQTAPFLFIGSGMSRRYLDLECWADLLKRFCSGTREFEYYLGQAEGNLAKAASYLAADFYEYWWKAPEYKGSRDQLKASIRSKADPLKLEISKYLKQKTESGAPASLAQEVSALKAVVIDGIITTNWDEFLEQCFSDYKSYVGQGQLLFSSPAGVAEIYKIHGCQSQPPSLVLTSEDYDQFRRQNPYLMAKMLTVFVEHPVLFLGYSLSDSHIHEMLDNLVRCLGTENVGRLQDNLIFIDRSTTEKSFARTVLKIDDSSIPITLIRTDDFLEVYKALGKAKRKVPVRILRWVKEHLYEIVKSSDPTGKVIVRDIEDEASFKKAEFVIGVGVSSKLGAIGYRSVEVSDLAQDILLEDKGYDYTQVLSQTFPSLATRYRYGFPVFRYLKLAGICSKEDFKASTYAQNEGFSNRVAEPRKWYAFNSNEYTRFQRRQGNTVDNALALTDPYKALQYLSYASWDTADMSKIKAFLVKNLDLLKDPNANRRRSILKVILFYDFVQNGWQ